jgi:hypothetical protein
MGSRRRIPNPQREHPTLPVRVPPEDTLRFSFKYLDADHRDFQFEAQETAYFLKLLARLQALSSLRLTDLWQSRQHHALRWHPIEWSRTTQKQGFPRTVPEEAQANAWQFSITANEHGRVHGFLVESTFFVVWLDPLHRLYSQ